MKNVKKLAFIALSIIALSCSKKEDDQPLLLPSAAFEKANNTVTAIPDCGNTNIPGSVEVPITIDKEGIIADGSKIYVELDLSHVYSAHIAVELITPSGDSIGLIKRLTGGYDNFLTGNKLVFNSAFTVAIPITGNQDTNIPAGNYRPSFIYNPQNEAVLPLTVIEKPMATFFELKSIKGVWKLKVYDCTYNFSGTLNAWKIKFDTGALQ